MTNYTIKFRRRTPSGKEYTSEVVLANATPADLVQVVAAMQQEGGTVLETAETPEAIPETMRDYLAEVRRQKGVE